MSDAFRALAEAAPDKAALLSDSGMLTRREVDELVDRFALALSRRGVQIDSPVAWLLHNRVDVVILALAVQRIGAVAVPLSYRLTPAELARMLPVVRPAVVVTEHGTSGLLAAIEPFASRELDVDHPETFDAASDAQVRPSAVGANRLGGAVSIVFTSGTTGRPKAALRNKGDGQLTDAIAERFRFDGDARYLVGGPLYHSGPLTCGLLVLAKGGTVGMLARFDARNWLDTVRARSMNAAFLTPTQLRRVADAVEAGEPAPTTLRGVVVSGEPFPADLKQRASVALGPVLIDCYGCTELGPLAAMPPDELLDRPTSCGRPFPGVELAAFDDNGRLPTGSAGKLHARTPLAFSGYLHPTTGRTDGEVGDWATVGDIGFVDRDGYVHLVDRADDLIITGGVNVFPSDVETVLAEHPAVRECMVVGVPDDTWGEAVCAVVVSDRALGLAEIREWMVGRIADDKRPRRLERVSTLPTTEIGKLSRRILRWSLISPERQAGG